MKEFIKNEPEKLSETEKLRKLGLRKGGRVTPKKGGNYERLKGVCIIGGIDQYGDLVINSEDGKFLDRMRGQCLSRKNIEENFIIKD